MSLLPSPLKIGVTLAIFHLEGKVAVTIQWLISLRKEFDIEFAAILNSLALIPSSPVALCGGIDTGISATSLLVIYGILSALSQGYKAKRKFLNQTLKPENPVRATRSLTNKTWRQRPMSQWSKRELTRTMQIKEIQRPNYRTHLFDDQSNLSIKLCPTHLRTRAKRKQKIVHCHGQFNIDCDNIVLAFEGFKEFLACPSINYVKRNEGVFCVTGA